MNSGDIAGLMLAVAPLANVLRYGTARKIPEAALRGLVTSLASEICAGLCLAARGLDDEAAAAMHRAMRGYDGAVSILDEPHFAADWQAALSKLAQDAQAAPFLRGYATRRLHDRGALAAEETERQLSFALSPAVAPAQAGSWLEGFLAEASQLLLHDASLFALIDRWLLGLEEDALVNLLPGLRRAFANLDRMERRRILEQAGRGVAPGMARAAPPGDARAEAAFEAALPLLKLILGLDGDES